MSASTFYVCHCKFFCIVQKEWKILQFEIFLFLFGYCDMGGLATDYMPTKKHGKYTTKNESNQMDMTQQSIISVYYSHNGQPRH